MRAPRVSVGGMVYHVINRANNRGNLFASPQGYVAFEKVLCDGLARFPTRLLAYCLMPNHWHLVLWPQRDGELSKFTGWVCRTHAQRLHAFRHTAGKGHIYQGRFRSFVVESETYFLRLCRYVERNGLRAGLTTTAQEWPWNSLAIQCGTAGHYPWPKPTLSSWPVTRPANWPDIVNGPDTVEELEAIRLCTRRGRPWGRARWVTDLVKRHGLESTIRPPYRPRRNTNPKALKKAAIRTKQSPR